MRIAIGFLIFVLASAQANACDRQDDPASDLAARTQKPAAAAFSADRPAAPREGEVWIDARSGAQEIYRDGEWRLRAPAIIRQAASAFEAARTD